MSGACPISFADIEAYCNLKGIYSLFERQRLLHFIDVLDRHWMVKHYEKQKGEMDRLNNKPRTRQSPEPKSPRRPRTRVS
jgi:hypothetical protein